MNLKQFTIYFFVLGVFTLLSGCFEAPNFSNIPRISFENIQFKEGNSLFDSLIISIHYEDGNGDLGLDDNFTDGDFIAGHYYTFNDKDPISIKDEGRPINIEGFEGSEVPPYERPYSCVNWIEKPNINGTVIQDTLFFVPNINQFNILISFLYRDKNSSENTPFQEFDWVGSEELPSCGSPINGRFPVLKDPSESAAPLEGMLRYGFVFAGLIPLFKDRELKLKVSIKDRALQESNTITITGSKENDNGVSFNLAGIQVN